MINVFLVEDERMALYALECKIRDLNSSYQVVGTASNGVEALEKLQNLHPDIIIADICMPEMDGITLIEHLSKERPEILPVILSGYQDFDYAKQAIRFGVQDYLLKPVSVDELRTCLDNCSGKLEQQKRSKNVVSFLIGEDTCSFSPADDTGECIVVYLIVSNAITAQNSILHPNVSYTACSNIEQFLTGFFPESVKLYCFDGLFSNEKALVLTGKNLNQRRISQILTALLPKLEAYFHNFVTVSFDSAENPTSISRVILSCRSRIVNGIILGKSRLCTEVLSRENIWPELKKQAELFLLLLNQNQLDLLRSNIMNLFRDWAKMERTACATQNDLVFLLEYFRHNSSQEPPLTSSFLVENLICFYQSDADFAESFYQLLIHFFNPRQTTAIMSAEELVNDIDIYLKEHLNHTISLQTLSDEFGVSKVYLCRIFKRHKNMTPIDYFNRLKIERAGQLLLQFPEMPLREIAALLSFSDIYYFSKVFKRITGKTPSEIRNQAQMSHDNEKNENPHNFCDHSNPDSIGPQKHP